MKLSPEQIRTQRAIKLETNNTALAIVNFLEKQLFRNRPVEDEVCHLTLDMWKDLRESILKGEYQEQGDKA